MGELHLDIIIDRLKREFKVECNQGKPQVNYKEAITKTVNLREVYKKQSGGRGKFADIIVNIGPVDEDFTQGDVYKRQRALILIHCLTNCVTVQAAMLHNSARAKL